MKAEEMRECAACYRRGLVAWEKLDAALSAFRRATEGLPKLFQAQRKLEGAVDHLTVIGEALAVLPGLVDELRHEKRIAELLRRQAQEKGLVFRYDDFDVTPDEEED